MRTAIGACLDDGRVARQRLSGLDTFESFLDFWLAAALMSVKKLPDFVDRSFFERIKIRPRE
jgi:hypothetical protein